MLWVLPAGMTPRAARSLLEEMPPWSCVGKREALELALRKRCSTARGSELMGNKGKGSARGAKVGAIKRGL